MELLDLFFGGFSIIFLGIFLTLILILLAKSIGHYPEPLPRSEKPKMEVLDSIIFWMINFVWLSFFIFLLNPIFINLFGDSYYIGLIVGTLINLLIPSIYVIYKDKWNVNDLALGTKVKSWPIAMYSIIFYLLFGIYNFFRLVPIQLPWYSLLLLFYSNAFLEEFFFRVIIQSKLERALGQFKAIVYQAILFMLIHIPANIIRFTMDGYLPRLIWNFGFQLMHGIIFGIIFMKTRNIWPSVICHFLNNWTGAIILLFI